MTSLSSPEELSYIDLADSARFSLSAFMFERLYHKIVIDILTCQIDGYRINSSAERNQVRQRHSTGTEEVGVEPGKAGADPPGLRVHAFPMGEGSDPAIGSGSSWHRRVHNRLQKERR